MQKHFISVTDERGNAVTSYRVTVYLAGTSTLASITHPDYGGGASNNYFDVSAEDGETWFIAANGEYDYTITNGPAGMDDETVDGVLLYDFRDGSLGDLTNVVIGSETLDLTTGADNRDIMGYNSATQTWEASHPIDDLLLDSYFPVLNDRSPGGLWLQASIAADAVMKVTQQNTGDIQQWLQGAGDGSVVAYITNAGGLSLSDDLTVGGDAVITGQLTVNGTITYVNSTTVEIGDNIILLNSGETGTPTQDAGFEIERGTSTNVMLFWDESALTWKFSDAGSGIHDIVAPDITFAWTAVQTFSAGIALGGELAMADNLLSRPYVKDFAEVVSAKGSVSSGTATFSLEDGNIGTITLGGNITIATSNWPASGRSGKLTLYITQDGTGGRTVTWPSAVAWGEAGEPILSTAAGATDVIVLTTNDAGTTIYGFTSGQGF